jgi:hypothetical protein
MNLTSEEKKSLPEKELRSQTIFSASQEDSLVHQFASDEDYSTQAKLMSYLRERAQICKLASVLKRKGDLMQISNDQLAGKASASPVTVKSILDDATRLIIANDSQIIRPGFLLKENEDLASVEVIAGDHTRQSSLEKINTRYCIEVLLIMFQCFFVLKNY